jgi:hypothetical protein
MKRVFEIFDEFNKAKTKEERKKILLENNTSPYVLQIVLQGAFHPGIEWVFKEPVAYKPQHIPAGLSHSTLAMEKEKFYIFTKDSKRVNPTLSYERKRQIFMQILESLEAQEAEVLMNMVLKDLKVKHLTYDLVMETFPDLLPPKEETAK